MSVISKAEVCVEDKGQNIYFLELVSFDRYISCQKIGLNGGEQEKEKEKNRCVNDPLRKERFVYSVSTEVELCI